MVESILMLLEYTGGMVFYLTTVLKVKIAMGHYLGQAVR